MGKGEPDLDTLPAAYREALCFFEAYRRLGFPAEEIFALFAGEDGHVQLCIVLRTQGAECVAVAGILTATVAEVEARWLATVAALNVGAFSREAETRAWRASMACAQFLEMPAVLAAKGIQILLPNSTMN